VVPHIHRVVHVALFFRLGKRYRRVQVWDVWNEPDNPNTQAYGKRDLANKAEVVLPWLSNVFAWTREAQPMQPLTSGVWLGTWATPDQLSPTEQLQLNQSDVISFHNYENLDHLKECVENLRRYHRPLLCTEYMSRAKGSTFRPHLAYMKDQGIAAYNWGLVAGKTQTNYPWDSWVKQYTAEPSLWFHDIFRPDGTPYRPQEIESIRRLTQPQ